MRDLKSYRGGGISRRYENTYVYRSFFLRDLFRKLTLLSNYLYLRENWWQNINLIELCLSFQNYDMWKHFREY